MFDILKAKDDFAVLGIQPQFPLDAHILETAFRERQRLMHPDQFVSADAAQQRLATQVSSLINDAYHRLRRPLNNAIALFTYYFGEDSLQIVKPDSVFLERVLEWREMADEAVAQKNLSALADLQDIIDQKTQECSIVLSEAFKSKERYRIADYLIQWHYLDKLSDDLAVMEEDILE